MEVVLSQAQETLAGWFPEGQGLLKTGLDVPEGRCMGHLRRRTAG